MSGPFRDPSPALIAEAERQLADLQWQRLELERRYEQARTRLDGKIESSRPAPVQWELELPREPEPPPPKADPGRLWIAVLAGVVVGLLMWLPIFSSGH